MKMRLDKFLADMGLGTRSEVKKAIRKGLAQVNAQTIREPEYKVDTEADQVLFGGQPAAYREFEYYMLNKPAGVISATEDPKERCVVDLIESRMRKDLFPVGRLDKDTEGLLLITNDGELIHRLLAPGRHVEKIYYARVRGEMTETDKNAFATGIVCSDFTALPAELELLRVEGGESEILLHLEEGKFHQVKRMVQAVGKEVLYLKRLSMGALRLDDALQPGEWRELTKEEKEALGCQEKKG